METICEAVGRPDMRFVPVKLVEQPFVFTLHQAHQGFVDQRTATMNRIRGLIAELGIVRPQRAAQLRRRRELSGIGALTASAWIANVGRCTNLPIQHVHRHSRGRTPPTGSA